MIWHERDGQRHVGHPGGLPGFGTLMRWVPELGLSAILLANVTYAKCEAPVRRALELVAREAALPRRIVRADPGLLAARDAVDGLVAALGRRGRRAPVHAQRRSRPPARRAPRRDRGAARSATARSARRRARARGRAARPWRLRGERGHVDLGITMAPTVPPLVQTLGVESVLPPAGLLATLATAAVAARERAAPRGARRAALARRSTPTRRCAGFASPRRSTARSASPRRSGATARRRSTLRLPSHAAPSSSSSSWTPAASAWRALVLRPAGLTEPF